MHLRLTTLARTSSPSAPGCARRTIRVFSDGVAAEIAIERGRRIRTALEKRRKPEPCRRVLCTPNPGTRAATGPSGPLRADCPRVPYRVGERPNADVL